MNNSIDKTSTTVRSSPRLACMTRPSARIPRGVAAQPGDPGQETYCPQETRVHARYAAEEPDVEWQDGE